MIELKDIEYITAISAAGGIQKAAKRVGLSQPGLTKRVKNLEDKLQMRLFDRLAKGVRLTPAGEVFLAKGQRLLAHKNDFQDFLHEYQQGRGGVISVGMKPGLEDAFFRRSVIEFMQSYPETELDIFIDATPSLAERIQKGQLDFAMGALGYADEHGSELVMSDNIAFEPLFEIPLEVFVRKGHPALSSSDPEILFDYPLICPTPPFELFQNLKRAYAARGSNIQRPHVRVDDFSLIYELVARSDMWSATFASNHTKLEMSDTFEVLGASPLLTPLTIGLIRRKTWSISPSAQNLIDIMKIHAEEWLIDRRAPVKLRA